MSEKGNQVEEAEILKTIPPESNQQSSTEEKTSTPKSETKNDNSSNDEDWIDNDTFLNSEIKKPAKAAERTADPFGEEESDEAIDKDIQSLENENDGSGQMSRVELFNISIFIITLLNTFVSEGSRWISGEPSSKPFSIDDGSKKDLAKMLAALLHKYQVKLGLGATFLFMCIMMFGAPVKEAFSIRREKRIYAQELAKQRTKTRRSKKKKKKEVKSESKILTYLQESGTKTVKELKAQFDALSITKIREELKQLITDGLVKVNESKMPFEYSFVKQ